jgi:hypothetical protein
VNESTAFADPELVELLADEPELLAIADAIAATSPTWTQARHFCILQKRRHAQPLRPIGRRGLALTALIGTAARAVGIGFRALSRRP